jgi:hypothetical protein
MPKAQLRQHQTTKTKGLSSAGMQIMGAAAKPAQLRHPWHHTLIRNDWRGMTDARPGEAGRDRPQRSRTPPGDQLTPGAATIIKSACPTCTQVPNMRSQSREIEHGIRAIDCPKDHSRSPGIPRRRLPSFAGMLPMRSGPLRGTRGSGTRKCNTAQAINDRNQPRRPAHWEGSEWSWGRSWRLNATSSGN